MGRSNARFMGNGVWVMWGYRGCGGERRGLAFVNTSCILSENSRTNAKPLPGSRAVVFWGDGD
jgi:hypothetical protein